MSECEKCGRDDGHYIGCPETRSDSVKVVEDDRLWANAEDLPSAEGLASATFCAFGECRNPRRPKGKGRAPLYCDEHSDPKNRK